MMLQEVMRSYFNNSLKENSNLMPILNYENKTSPVLPKSSKWESSEKSISRKYEFESRKQKEAFIVEILKYIRESECDIEFTVRENNVNICIHSDMKICWATDVRYIRPILEHPAYNNGHYFNVPCC